MRLGTANPTMKPTTRIATNRDPSRASGAASSDDPWGSISGRKRPGRDPPEHSPAEYTPQPDEQRSHADIPHKDHCGGVNDVKQRQRRRRDRGNGQAAHHDNRRRPEWSRIAQHHEHCERQWQAGQHEVAKHRAVTAPVVTMPSRLFENALGMTPAALAEYAEAAVTSRVLPEPKPDHPEPVFDFILAPKLESV